VAGADRADGLAAVCGNLDDGAKRLLVGGHGDVSGLA
jgi:hypothetical protein